MTLYMPVGPPGCGKTTLKERALAVGVITQDAVVCPDDIRLWLTGRREAQHRNRQVFEIAHLAAKIRLEEKQDVWFDATNLFASEVPDFAYLRNIPVVTIMFDTPASVLWERNKTREHPVPDSVLEKMISRYAIWRATFTESYITEAAFLEKYGNR